MQSVADVLRQRTREDARRLTPGERIALALSLGDGDARLFAAARGVSVDEARRLLRARRQHGRRRSSCLEQAP
jgi:hypothetical protein